MLTFHDVFAFQQAGVSVNVSFYFKDPGKQGGERPSKRNELRKGSVKMRVQYTAIIDRNKLFS